MKNEQKAIDDLANDIVWEIAGIGKAIGRDRRSALHLVQRGAIPAKKVGGRWCASRKALRQTLIGQQEEGCPAE